MGALGNIVPLLVLFVFVGVFAWIGYQMTVYTNELKERGIKKMEKKNIMLTKDGMKVGVKEVRDEDYADATQSVFVKAWNYASFPAYKSRLGWNTTAADAKSSSSKAKPSGDVKSRK